MNYSIKFRKAKDSKLEKVFFSPIDNDKQYFSDDDLLFFTDNLNLEPYSGFLNDGFVRNDLLSSMGAFSYTWSKLPFWLKVGRYSSIAHGLRFMGPRHPYERVTSSSVTYDSNFIIISQFLRDNSKRFEQEGFEVY